MARQEPGRHEPDDEYVPHKQCSDKEPHEDHYWDMRTGGAVVVQDDNEAYCYGIKVSS